MKKNHSEDPLLQLALTSLETQVSDKKRKEIFDANQGAIEQLKKAQSTCTNVGSLQIKQTIEGKDVEDEMPVPLVKAGTIMIDLQSISLTNQYDNQYEW